MRLLKVVKILIPISLKATLIFSFLKRFSYSVKDQLFLRKSYDSVYAIQIAVTCFRDLYTSLSFSQFRDLYTSLSFSQFSADLRVCNQYFHFSV